MAVCKALRFLPFLQIIDLSHNNLSPKVFRELFASLTASPFNLSSLKLDENKPKNKGVKAMKAHLRSLTSTSELRDLSLSGCDLSDQQASSLISFLPPSIQSFNISNNSLSSLSIEILVEKIQSNQVCFFGFGYHSLFKYLFRLEISFISLYLEIGSSFLSFLLVIQLFFDTPNTHASALLLFSSLQNLVCVEEVDLSWNGIGDEVVDYGDDEEEDVEVFFQFIL